MERDVAVLVPHVPVALVVGAHPEHALIHLAHQPDAADSVDGAHGHRGEGQRARVPHLHDGAHRVLGVLGRHVAHLQHRQGGAHQEQDEPQSPIIKNHVELRLTIKIIPVLPYILSKSSRGLSSVCVADAWDAS